MRTENGFLVGTWQEADLTTSANANTVTQMCPASAIITVSSALVVGRLITMTTPVAHGFFDGESVNILGTGDATVDGYQKISVLSAVTFSFFATGAPTLTSQSFAGTVTVGTFKVRAALVLWDGGNAAPVSIGPNSNATARPLSTATAIEYQIPQSIGPNGLGVVFDLATWYMK